MYIKVIIGKVNTLGIVEEVKEEVTRKINSISEELYLELNFDYSEVSVYIGNAGYVEVTFTVEDDILEKVSTSMGFEVSQAELNRMLVSLLSSGVEFMDSLSMEDLEKHLSTDVDEPEIIEESNNFKGAHTSKVRINMDVNGLDHYFEASGKDDIIDKLVEALPEVLPEVKQEFKVKDLEAEVIEFTNDEFTIELSTKEISKAAAMLLEEDGYAAEEVSEVFFQIATYLQDVLNDHSNTLFKCDIIEDGKGNDFYAFETDDIEEGGNVTKIGKASPVFTLLDAS